jgi:hypothetical protein
MGRLVQVDGAGETARKPEAGWQTSRMVPLPGMGAVEITNNWRFAALDGSNAVLNGDMRMEVKRPADAPAEAPTMTIDDQQGETAILWDAQAGALKRRATEQTVRSTWTLRELVVKQAQKFTLSIDAE